jgi:hypothetical protein
MFGTDLPPTDPTRDTPAPCESSQAEHRAAAGSDPQLKDQNVDDLLADLGFKSSFARLGRSDEPVRFVRVPSVRPESAPLRKAPLPSVRPLSALGAGSRGGVAKPLTGGPTAEEMRLVARDLDLRLKEDLARTPSDNRIARLGIHRRALSDFIDTQRDPSAKSLLSSVLAEYDALHFESIGSEMAEMLERVRAAEAREVAVREQLQTQQRRNAQLHLDRENLRRKLSNRTEVLAHIAQTYQIAIAGLTSDDDASGESATLAPSTNATGGRSLTIADIRRNQQRLENKYGNFVRSADEVIHPSDFCEADDGVVGTDVQGRSPDEVDGAGGPNRPTKLNLLREVTSLEASAVPLEDDVPPELMEENRHEAQLRRNGL